MDEEISADAIPRAAAERIVLGLRAKGRTQKQAAEDLGVEPGTVSRWLRRRGPMPMRALSYFADVLGVTVPALLEANAVTIPSPPDGIAARDQRQSGSDGHFFTDSGHDGAARSGRSPQMGIAPWSQGTLVLVAVPIIGRANMGVGGGPVEGQAIELPQILLAGRNVLALEVYGSCMEPEYSPGDIVLVDQDMTPRDGDIVAAELPGSDEGPLVKRFYRHQTPEGSEIELRPNIVGAGVGTRIRRPEAEIRVHGVVYLHIRRISRGVVTTTHLQLVTDRVG